MAIFYYSAMPMLEERGYFWWFDEPMRDGMMTAENCVAGILKISEQGNITLELDSPLSRPDSITIDFSREDKSVAGFLIKTKEFILLKNLSPTKLLNHVYSSTARRRS
jgi:hypothetical protein